MKLSRTGPFLFRPMKSPGSPPNGHVEQGFTLFELLLVMVVAGILFTMTAVSVKGLHNDADSAASAVSASLLQARTQAFSTTSAVRVTLTDADSLLFEINSACSVKTNWAVLNNITPDFPTGVMITPTATLKTPWSVCFTTRGDLVLPAPSPLVVSDASKHNRLLTVYLTGSVNMASVSQ